jgi:hypothetical protein
MTLILAMTAFACAGEKNEAKSTETDEELAPLVESQGGLRMELDATNRTEWIGLDLDQGRVISTQDFPADSGWDLAFKRTTIKMGSAVGMQTVNQEYASITVTPQDGYTSDQPPSEAGAPETSGLAFHMEPSWYAYDVTTHAVSSRGFSYVLRSNEGRYFKLKIHVYYNAARLPAYINLEFQELKGVNP